MTREEIIKELSVEYLGDSEKMIKAKKMAVKAQEQEPRKGHWIPYLKEGLIVKCSECKSRYTLGYNYCPNCGADMGDKE